MATDNSVYGMQFKYINSSIRREKMLRLSEELLRVEKDRISGRSGCSINALDSELKSIINEVAHCGNQKTSTSE